MTVDVPPLRHHIEDIRELVPFFLSQLTEAALTCSPEAMHQILRSAWPGNTAELRHALKQIVQHRRRTGVVILRPTSPPTCRPSAAGASASWRPSNATRSSAASSTTTATAARPPGPWACPEPPSTARSTTTASAEDPLASAELALERALGEDRSSGLLGCGGGVEAGLADRVDAALVPVDEGLELGAFAEAGLDP